MNKRYGKLVTSAAVLIPALATGCFLLSFVVDVPYFDEWDLAPLIGRVAREEATIGDFYQQHGAHRILVPKLILSHLAVATGWNVRIEVALNFLLVLATLPALLTLSRRLLRLDERDRLLFSLTISAVLFAPIAVESWLSGWHLGWFLTNACVIWAAAILSGSVRAGMGRLLVAALLCLIASFSIAHGLVTWVALSPAVAANSRKKLPALLLWGFLFLGTLTLYFNGYEPVHPELAGPIVQRLSVISLYSLAAIGSPVANVVWLAIMAGLMMTAAVLALIFILWRVDASPALAGWVSLALYVFGFAGANAIGRAGWGLERALSSPYKLVTSLILVVILHLVALYAMRGRIGLRTARAFAGATIAFMIAGALTILPHASQQRTLRSEGKLCLQTALLISEDTPACRPALAWPYLDPIEEARQLHEAGVFDLPDHDAFEDDFAPGELDTAASGLHRFGRTGQRMVIEGSIETEGREQTLLILTRDENRDVIATRLLSHAGERTLRWKVELPSHPGSLDNVRAWVYDGRTRSFRRLRGVPGPVTGG